MYKGSFVDYGFKKRFPILLALFDTFIKTE